MRHKEFLNGLRAAHPEMAISVDPSDLATWGTDWTRNFKVDPTAVVFPKTVEQTVAIVEKAIATRTPLVPSGGRTGLSGGAVASDGEIVVSFERMNRLVDFNSVDRVVRCEAGVTTGKLQEFAESKGLFYPVDFSSSGSSQIGGNVATNAGGIRVIRHGMTREQVAGLTVVTGTGEVLELNGSLVKNATGYDLRHLFIGSEGTLGLIVEAELRLANPPAPQRVMVLGIHSMDCILNVLKLFQSRIALSAFEFFSDLAMQKVLQHREVQPPFERACPIYALIEYDESDDAVALEAFTESVDSAWVMDGVVSQSLSQARALWQLREGITESIAGQTPYKNDISVRISEIPGFLDEVNAFVNERYPDFEVCWFGHIGDGNLHLNILRPVGQSVAEFFETCHGISRDLFEIVASRRGSISAEHGVGLLKRDYLHYTRSAQEIELMGRMKATFDPHGIMNPGKLLPAG